MRIRSCTHKMASKEKESVSNTSKDTVLTRSARKRAGVPPPTPFFKGVPKLHLATSTDHETSLTTHNKSKTSLVNVSQYGDQGNSTTTASTCTTKEDSPQNNGPNIASSVANTIIKSRRRKRRSKSKKITQTIKPPKCHHSNADCDSSSSSSSSDDESSRPTWVQCDHLGCQKWRKIPFGTDIDQSKEWYCSMHPDPAYQSCDMAEERWQVSKKRAFTFTRLDKGTLVWAKMSGFPPWPAIVSPDPWSTGMEYVMVEREGCIYHVEFLGKNRSHLWIQEEKIEPYRSGQKTTLNTTLPHSKRRVRRKGRVVGNLSQNPKTQQLTLAISEADTLVDCTDEQRLSHCIFTEKLTSQRLVKTEPEVGNQPKRIKCTYSRKIKSEPENDKSKDKRLVENLASSNKSLTNVTNLDCNVNGQSLNATRTGHFQSNATNFIADVSSQAQLLKCLGIENAPTTATNLLHTLQSQLTVLLNSTSSTSQSSSSRAQPQPRRSLPSNDAPSSKHKRDIHKRKTHVKIGTKAASKLQISPRLIQAGLETKSHTNLVQVVPRKPGRPKTKGKKQAARKSRISPYQRRNCLPMVSTSQIVSPTIEDYFRKSTESSPHGSGGGGMQMSGQQGEKTIRSDQQVPDVSESPIHALSHETQTAQSELLEIQDMLSMFEQPTAPTTSMETSMSELKPAIGNSDSSNFVTEMNHSKSQLPSKHAVCYPNLSTQPKFNGRLQDTKDKEQHQGNDGSHDDVEFDSVLNELQCIEELIQNLSSSELQVVPTVANI